MKITITKDEYDALRDIIERANFDDRTIGVAKNILKKYKDAELEQRVEGIRVTVKINHGGQILCLEEIERIASQIKLEDSELLTHK